MVDKVKSLNADAMINIRYASSAVMQGATKVIAYGNYGKNHVESIGSTTAFQMRYRATGVPPFLN